MQVINFIFLRNKKEDNVLLPLTKKLNIDLDLLIAVTDILNEGSEGLFQKRVLFFLGWVTLGFLIMDKDLKSNSEKAKTAIRNFINIICFKEIRKFSKSTILNR
jgi:hypothetical protein